MKYPKKLQAGATIGLICASSATTEENKEKMLTTLQSMGFRVKMADNLTTTYAGYMAGTGEVRAHWVNAMFADPEVDVVLCVRGGDGSSRLMEYLDLDMIRANPKIFIGYSDITNLHLVFNQQCGFVTFHGPMAASNMIDHFDEESKASLIQALNAEDDYEFKNPEGYEISVLKEGKAQGILVGGNLSLLCASVGTPYELDTDGKILFIEEVGENTSRVERFVYHLRNAGKFRNCAGVILGQFTRCPNPWEESYTEIDCFRDALADLDIPVLYNIQAGHDYPNMTLPMGGLCTIDTNRRSISFAAPQR